MPLQMLHAIFREFCDWLLISSPSLRAWAADSKITQHSCETNDKTRPAHTNAGNSATETSEKHDQGLGSLSSADDLVKHGQEYPKRPRRSVLDTSHTLSLESRDRGCNSAILHSSLVAAIQSQRSTLGFQNDCYINLPGFSSAQQHITIMHLISSLCKQLLSHQPALVSSIQHLLENTDALKEEFNPNLTEKLLWNCLIRLLQSRSTGTTFILIYKPTNPALAIPYSKIYHRILQLAEKVELRIKLLYIRQRIPVISETDFVDPVVETTILLAGDEVMASLNRDIISQFNATTTHECFISTLESDPKVLSHLILNPLDGPIFCALVSRKVIASSHFLDHGGHNSQQDILSLIFDSIPLSQRSSVVTGLMLLICGARPLAVSEFRAALLTSADMSPDSMEYAEFLADEFMYLLCGLIEIREDFVCIAHARLVEFIVDINGTDTKWYSISIPEGHQKLADICFKSIMAASEQDMIKGIPSVESEKKNGSRNDRYPLLSYAVDSWWIHAKVLEEFSASTLSAEAKRKLDIWLSVWRSMTKPSRQETSTTESKPDEHILCLIFLSSHLQQPMDDCVQLTLDANRMQDPPDHDPWSFMTLAASKWRKEEMLTKLISKFNFLDSRTLLTVFQTCAESILRSLLPSLSSFCEDNLQKLLFIAVYCEHEKLLDDLIKTFETGPVSSVNEIRMCLLDVYATRCSSLA